MSWSLVNLLCQFCLSGGRSEIVVDNDEIVFFLLRGFKLKCLPMFFGTEVLVNDVAENRHSLERYYEKNATYENKESIQADGSDHN